MKLISSADSLNFLSKSAPRPWVKRMLKWMIYEGELSPYFTHGKITPFTSVLGVLVQVDGLAQLEAGPKRDAAIRAQFESELADQLIGRDRFAEVFGEPVEWDESEEPHQVGPGFFLYADEIDWEEGSIIAEIHYPESQEEHHLFWDAEEHLSAQFERSQYKAELSGLRFSLDALEMMLPTVEPSASRATSDSEHVTAIGRPRKWDWEGAFAKLALVAQHPDGLPVGPGAQAQIERILSEWFVAETGDSPATSQIRQRAQKMMRLLQPSRP